MLLKSPTPSAWAAAVLADLDAFLIDHAANERKASSSAMALVAHYPDRPELVRRCIALAIEELQHFGQVQARIAERGLALGPDTRSAYLQRLRKEFREGSEPYFLDRLLTAGIVEARGCERFGLLAAALEDGVLKDFYRDLARSEVRHQEMYIDLARAYFPAEVVGARLEELLEVEAEVVRALPIRAALY
jgi:tRNA 2-(methylsulfanyl)-N6-isopentenyladenosine37 hydroxylase